jgi:sulfite reductase alpha subunit-like flavoprotein
LPYKTVEPGSSEALTTGDGIPFDMNAKNYMRSFDC